MYETAISVATTFALIFALAFSACGQEQAVFQTDNATVHVVNAGEDALMIRCGNALGVIEIKNLEHAGSVSEQFVAALMMADDGGDNYRTFLRTTGQKSSYDLKVYWQKAVSARERLVKILGERTVVFLTHKHRQYNYVNQ